MPDTKNFVGHGTVLFIDGLVLAIANWMFWLTISKFTLPSEVGQATIVYSLATLISMSTQLGLEYTLLRKSSTELSKVLGTALMLELIIAVVFIPILIFVMTEIYHESVRDYIWIAVGIFITSSVGFITRYSLLGTSDVKCILLIDLIGTSAKFLTGFVLVSSGYGAFGILLSFLLQGFIIMGATMAILASRLDMNFARADMRYVKEILFDGLINTPFKLSKVFILYLSIVLLASFGISNSDTGVFYISLMISIIAGSLASSFAIMVIPASSISKKDLSSVSTRIGLSLSAPIIAALVSSPKFILSLISMQYIVGDTVLLILSIGILPYSLTLNAIASLNNRGKQRKIVFIGFTEILVFLVGFFLLVPSYGTVGAALSMLIAFIISSIPSLIWSNRAIIRYIAVSAIAIAVGSMAASLLRILIGVDNPLAELFSSMTITTLLIIILKNTTPVEIKKAAIAIIKKRI